MNDGRIIECRYCRFYYGHHGEEGEGECHAHAPAPRHTPVGDPDARWALGALTVWPRVMATEFCGEWRHGRGTNE